MTLLHYSSKFVLVPTLFLIILILANINFSLDNNFDVCANPIPDKTDYTVTGTLSISNENFTHTGSIIVTNGGHLTLENVTIFFKRDPAVTSNVCEFIIENGGKLEMSKSRIGSVSGTENYLKMNFIIDGDAVIKDCEIFNVGKPFGDGFKISSDNVILERTTIRDSATYGIQIQNVVSTIKNCVVINNLGEGIIVHGAAPSISDTIIKNNGAGGIFVEDFEGPGGVIDNCKIISNTDCGIKLYSAMASVSNCIIEKINGNGIEVTTINASLKTINDNTIKDTITGIALYYVESASISNNLFQNNNIHLKLSGSDGVTTGNIYEAAEEYKVSIYDSDFDLNDGPRDVNDYKNDGSNNVRVWRPVSVNIKDKNGLPAPNVILDITNKSGNYLFSEISNPSGIVTGKVLIAKLIADEFLTNEPLSLTALKEGSGAVMAVHPDNLSALNVTIEPLPDYNVIDFNIYSQQDPGNISNELVIDIIVNNEGASTSPPTIAIVTIDDQIFDPISVPLLQPNSEITLTEHWTPSTQDTYAVEISVDPEENVLELLESNNVLEKSIAVRADLEIIEDQISFTPFNATEGTQIELISFVSNIGLWGDGPIKITLSVDGRTVDEQTQPYIGANETLQIIFTTEATGGDMEIEVQVRFEDDDKEFDISNNQASITYSSIGTDKDFSWDLVYIGATVVIIILVGLIAFFVFYRKRSAKEEKDFIESMKFDVDTYLEYQKGRLFYSFILKNSTPHPISDIHVRPVLPTGTFKPDSDVKTLTMLETKATETVRFELRPLGECGNREIWGSVDFYDFEHKGRRTIQTDKKVAEVVCPVLRAEQIALQAFTSYISTMKKSEEVADQVPVPARQLFDVVCNVLQGKNMTPLPSEIHDSKISFRGVGRFWATGIKGIKYGVIAEVIGGKDMARLILRVFSSDEKTLVGFTQAILDAVQPHLPVREHVKPKFILELIEGDLVAGKDIKITDSVIQRSKIG